LRIIFSPFQLDLQRFPLQGVSSSTGPASSARETIRADREDDLPGTGVTLEDDLASSPE
jgi:hypothetical protein